MNRLKNILFFCVLICLVISDRLYSQRRKESLPSNYNVYKFVKPGDTLHVELGEITILPKPKFNNRDDIRYYLWLKRKVCKAYPYAKIASDRLKVLNSRLEKIHSKQKQKKYTRLIQEYLEGEFTEQIKKMTRTEGRILIKLIHRQTGSTVFDNIKIYRSGWKAFWYNSTATFFKLSLKDEYHPESVNEDFLVEDILQRAFLEDILEKQESKLDFNYLKIASARDLKINVDEYRQFFAKMKSRKKIKKKK
mgnify:CR=1 FL=1